MPAIRIDTPAQARCGTAVPDPGDTRRTRFGHQQYLFRGRVLRMTSTGQSPAWWRGYINQITHGADLRAPIDDWLLNRLSDELISQRLFTLPVADYYRAATEALRSSEDLGSVDGHDDSAVRNLLARLIEALDSRKPWAEPPFEALPVDEPATLTSAALIGRVPILPRDVEGRLNQNLLSASLTAEKVNSSRCACVPDNSWFCVLRLSRSRT